MSEAAATAAGIALYPSGGAAASGASVGGGIAVGGAVQIVTIFGVSLGLRPELLVAGMLGALAAIFLLNSVPLQGEGLYARLSNMVQRFFVVVSSAVTSGYLVPLIAALTPAIPEEWLLGSAFVVGAGAQRVLQKYVNKYADSAIDPAPPKNPSQPALNPATKD